MTSRQLAPAGNPSGKSCAWVTLLTRSSYTPGVITLAYTLEKHQTKYPLIVLVTASLPASSLRALEFEAARNSLLLIHPTTPLVPPSHSLSRNTNGHGNSPPQEQNLIAARFADTWTKLRVFEITGYKTLTFLDADITIFKNIDELFDTPLPGPYHLAANHACVCNLDHDTWAPADWKAENCAYTPLERHSASTAPTPVPHSSTLSAPNNGRNAKPTHTLLNSGLFIFHPSPDLSQSLLSHFNNPSTPLSSFLFPDQDFLAHFFKDKWVSLPWLFNALKTMRYWHENLWVDEDVGGLHYIVDKPWSARIARDGVAGHLGRDGITHGWWWDIWEEWRGGRLKRGDQELVEIMDGLVASGLDAEGERKQIEDNISKGFPIAVPEHPGQVHGALERKSALPT